MNRHTVCATFVAAIGAALALASTNAFAGKPVPADPCATAGDFPAFAYRIAATNSKPSKIYIADTTGKCSRLLVATQPAGVPKLSYPVDGTSNKGRVVWTENYTAIYAVDFSVSAGNAISVSTAVMLYANAGCCSLDLSKDGQTVYFTDTDTSLATLDVGTPGVAHRIYELPPGDTSWFFMQASANGDGKQLYATKYGSQSNNGASQLVRIDLTFSPAKEVVLRQWLPHTGYGAHVFSPAANQYDDRVAFLTYLEGTNNCTQLVVTDKDGGQLFPALSVPARYGKFPTWVGNNVVMERRSPMDGSGKCADTTWLAQIDLVNNAETVLVTGTQPNGR